MRVLNNVVEFFAGEARRLTGETIPSELPYNFCYTLKQPMGPMAIITPWNFPVAIPIWKMAPALVSGNTVVVLDRRPGRLPARPT